MLEYIYGPRIFLGEHTVAVVSIRPFFVNSYQKLMLLITNAPSDKGYLKVIVNLKDLSYFSKTPWKNFAEKTIKIISEEIIMLYVQL
jgi:hypothetical protein